VAPRFIAWLAERLAETIDSLRGDRVVVEFDGPAAAGKTDIR